MSQHSLFIVAVQHKAWFDQQAEAMGNGGPALSMVLSINGQTPATHGWCAVKLSEANDSAVASLMAANPDKEVVWRKYDLGSQPGYPDTVLAELGLKHIVKPMMP